MSVNGKRTGSLSLDLDNQWSYMKASGIPGWDAYPSYFDRLVPRILETLDRHGLAITFFIVGKDASLPQNGPLLREIARTHEIANHSYRHEPSISQLSTHAIAAELKKADDAIEAATGVRPRGFRGPSFAISTPLLEALQRLSYDYDASTFPTFIGPLARRFHEKQSALSAAEKAERAHVFGTFVDGLRPLKPYMWRLGTDSLIEVPVTTVPIVRSPFHLTYLTFLAQVSPAAARLYFRGAITACRLFGIEPSLLLHPLDFVGGDELPVLASFPGMRLATKDKLAFLDDVLATYAAAFDVVPMSTHVRRIRERGGLRLVAPSFAADAVS